VQEAVRGDCSGIKEKTLLFSSEIRRKKDGKKRQILPIPARLF